MPRKTRFARQAKPSFLRTHAGWVILVIVIDIVLGVWYFRYHRKPSAPTPKPEMAGKSEAAVPAPPKIEPIRLGYPTDRQNLRADNPSDFMPTASGKTESALYGSVRTVRSGSGLISQFHEGIDIAPLARDAARRPVDSVYAAAEGRVGYINRVVGNSSYGHYVVLLHPDPIGEIYTLYAHLAAIAPGLKIGDPVRRGSLLGLMGNTAASPIPLERAHLHFEIGLINNSRFERWFRTQRMTPDHGLYNGHNLTGIHPLEVFSRCDSDGVIQFEDHVRHLPVAFELALKKSTQLDFFTQYPSLWQGTAYDGRGLHLSVSEGGALIQGRNLEPEEKKRLDNKRTLVLRVDEAVLGRNGRHLIVHRESSWDIGANGRQWLDVLSY